MHRHVHGHVYRHVYRRAISRDSTHSSSSRHDKYGYNGYDKYGYTPIHLGATCGAGAVFSNKHKDKTIVVKGGKVEVDGVEIEVEWLGAFTDGSKQINSIDEKIGGKVALSDSTAFENRLVDKEILDRLIRENPEDVLKRDHQGNLPLHLLLHECECNDGPIKLSEVWPYGPRPYGIRPLYPIACDQRHLWPMRLIAYMTCRL